MVKTTGDGAHAAFVTASDAVDAAIAAQLALGAATWGATGPLLVRMGIHTGAAELRDGDYYGTALNRAARIASVAHGGQIVVSLTSSDLLRDAPVELLDLGEHRLRDLGEPERIFQVIHPDLRREFAPLRSVGTYRTNLPLQTTSFIGREDDMAEVTDALRTARLVTLTGVGGVGKTRLAIQVGRRAVAALSRRRVALRARPTRRCRCSTRCRGRRLGGAATTGRDDDRQHHRRAAQQAHHCRARQLRAPDRRRRAIRSTRYSRRALTFACSRPAGKGSAFAANR